MDAKRLEIQELQISDDLDDSFSLYDLEDLVSHTELTEGLVSIGSLGRQFRHVHIELKDVMDEEEYNAKYLAKYTTTHTKVRKYQTDGRQRIRDLNTVVIPQVEASDESTASTESESKEQQESKETERVRASILTEEQIFQEKLAFEIEGFGTVSQSSVENSCRRFEYLLDKYYNLLSKAKVAFDKDSFEKDCKVLFDETLSKIREQIKVGKARLVELATLERKESERVERERNKLAHDTLAKEQLAIARVLSEEIDLRSKTIVSKCDHLKLSDFDDHKLLDCLKNLPSIDIEVREILGKFTEFSKITALYSSPDDNFVENTCKAKSDALKVRNDYAIELYKIISLRDVSEGKLKRSKALPIDLPKFKGFDSKLDIYSFKSEFEKLIEPSIQSVTWFKTLKNNYLSGPAFTLVDKLDNIDEAWKKLIEAYGNVRLLLQNKIADLDKFENLQKLKGDEKIGSALAKIINMMIDLSTLAEKHNLEAKLYVGGGLEKVLNLIGDDRERRFLSKYVETVSSDSNDSEVVVEKRKWTKLIEYLKKELTLREQMTLLSRSKASFGLDTSFRSPDDIAHPILCHICGEGNHTLSTDEEGRNHCNYVSCREFITMTCDDRLSVLVDKKFCLTCLSPGVERKGTHECSQEYVCPHDEPTSYSPNGIHVLLCEDHKDLPENLLLRQEYMDTS